MAVAWSHWERPYQFGIPFGAGVHLFYVLSGFLITGILLDVRALADRVTALKAFYIRRSLRIFPAFYLTLALVWWADLPLVRESFWWHAGYLSNVFIFLRGEWPGTISHFWSLAVEEQFYLLWPGLIVFARREWIAPAMLLAIAAAPLSRWWLASAGYSESMHALLTIACFDSLGVGAWLAFRASDGRAWRSLALAALGAWLAVSFAQAAEAAPQWAVALKQTLQAIVFGWIVRRAVDGFSGIAGAILSAPPLVAVGRVSYGLYLAHGFAGAMAFSLFSLLGFDWPVAEPLRLLVLAGVTLAAATVSWHLVERPLNELKRRFPYAR